MDSYSSPYIVHYGSFHFLFHSSYITPIYTPSSLFTPYIIPIINEVSIFFSIPSFPANQGPLGPMTFMSGRKEGVKIPAGRRKMAGASFT